MSDVISVDNLRGATIVALKRDVTLDIDRLHQVETELQEIISAGEQQKVVLDFSEVDSISSQALSLLLALRRDALARGIHIALSHLRPELVNVLRMTNLDRLFTISPDNESAIDSLDAPRREP